MNSAEKQLEEIRKILFPDSVYNTDVDESGREIKYRIDYSADFNLQAALNDIQEGYIDETAYLTVSDVMNRIIKIREILEEHLMVTEDIEFFVVENLRKDDVEDIEWK